MSEVYITHDVIAAERVVIKGQTPRRRDFWRVLFGSFRPQILIRKYVDPRRSDVDVLLHTGKDPKRQYLSDIIGLAPLPREERLRLYREEEHKVEPTLLEQVALGKLFPNSGS